MKLFIQVKKAKVEAPKKNPVPAYVSMDLSLVGVTPRECKACGHIYVQPCDGKDTCPNMAGKQPPKKKAFIFKKSGQ
jgi:hypothetical protein